MIAEAIGLDLRARLLDGELVEALRREGLSAGLYALPPSDPRFGAVPCWAKLN